MNIWWNHEIDENLETGETLSKLTNLNGLWKLINFKTVWNLNIREAEE